MQARLLESARRPGARHLAAEYTPPSSRTRTRVCSSIGGQPFARGVERAVHRRWSQSRCHDDRVRLHEHQGRARVPPDSGQGNSEQSVACLEVRVLRRAPHRYQLLPQRQVLQDQFQMSAERQCQQPAADHDKQLQPAAILAGTDVKINGTSSGEGHRDRGTSPRCRFGRHPRG